MKRFSILLMALATLHAMRPGSATITVKAPTPDGQNNGPQATLDVTVTE